MKRFCRSEGIGGHTHLCTGLWVRALLVWPDNTQPIGDTNILYFWKINMVCHGQSTRCLVCFTFSFLTQSVALSFLNGITSAGQDTRLTGMLLVISYMV